jgi:hypothetical protein
MSIVLNGSDEQNASLASPQSAPEAPQQQADGNGRDARGRFADGNPGGRGNPFARKVAALRAALVESVTATDIEEIAAALKAQAKKGDTPAARLLLAYSLGKPAPAVDPDRLDIEEWKVAQETAARPDDILRAIRGYPVDMVSTLILAALPGKGVGFADRFIKRSKAIDKRVRLRAERRAEEERRIAAARAGQTPEAPSTTASNGGDAGLQPEAPSTTGL